MKHLVAFTLFVLSCSYAFTQTTHSESVKGSKWSVSGVLGGQGLLGAVEVGYHTGKFHEFSLGLTFVPYLSYKNHFIPISKKYGFNAYLGANLGMAPNYFNPEMDFLKMMYSTSGVSGIRWQNKTGWLGVNAELLYLAYTSENDYGTSKGRFLDQYVQAMPWAGFRLSIKPAVLFSL